MLRGLTARSRLHRVHSTLSSLCQQAWLATDTSQHDKAIYVTLPQMSPSMTQGSVAKWHKAKGDALAQYDVIMEVNTESLTEEAYKVGEFEGTTTMLVESQDEGWLHSVLVPEGKTVPVGTTVAIMTEFEEDLEALDERKFEAVKPPESGRQLTWQSYLKSDEGKEKAGCS